MIFYVFGMVFLPFASAPWMFVPGFVLAGLAVGAGIAASWSLTAEQIEARRVHAGDCR